MRAAVLQVLGHREVGVMAYDEARVEIVSGKIWDCAAKHGVYAKGKGTSVSIANSEVFECGISCVVAADGASVTVMLLLRLTPSVTR